MTKVYFGEMESPVGTIELAVRDDTLCALNFAGGHKSVGEIVRRRFGDIAMTPLPARHDVARRLRAYFGGDIAAIDGIAVDAAGTPFQRSVWAQLRRIPAGQTASYRDVAAAVGAAGAVRAVGTANGSNPIGIVVPCHRVVRSDGDLGGYGGGLQRKRWLLQHEGAGARVRIPAGVLA
jgi:methylated-DNA-[protein]-cysteine S-methyltransferase